MARKKSFWHKVLDVIWRVLFNTWGFKCFDYNNWFNLNYPDIDDIEPYRMNEIDFPTADENRPIPEVFGTCNIKPNLVWMGDFHYHSLRQRTE